MLGVGSAGETHFVFGDDRFSPWGTEFERAAARDGLQPQDPVRAGRVRDWIDAMVPRLGLRDEVADLILLAWAALRQRAWYQHGSPVPAPKPGTVRPEMELRPEPLPAPGDWQVSVSRAEQIFGIHVNPYLTAASVAGLAGELGEDAGRARRCGLGADRPGRGGLRAPGHSRRTSRDGCARHGPAPS